MSLKYDDFYIPPDFPYGKTADWSGWDVATFDDSATIREIVLSFADCVIEEAWASMRISANAKNIEVSNGMDDMWATVPLEKVLRVAVITEVDDHSVEDGIGEAAVTLSELRKTLLSAVSDINEILGNGGKE